MRARRVGRDSGSGGKHGGNVASAQHCRYHPRVRTTSPEAVGRAARLAKVREALDRNGAEWLLVAPSPDFRWLTGAVARSTERLVLFALPRAGDPFCVVPRLEASALAHECPGLELVIWDEHEDPFARLATRIGLEHRPPVLVSDGLRVAPLLRLAAATACRPAGIALEPLRAIKDADELEHLAAA